MEIAKGIRVYGNSLLIGKSLIISDVHLGQEEALNRKGVLIPRFQFKDVEDKIMGLIEETNPEEFIITGDLKHEFGSILDTEWRNILKLIGQILVKCKRVILVKGNHDIMLGPIARKKDVFIDKNYFIGKTLICHGDIVPEKELLNKCDTILIGHEHPAIALSKDKRIEKFKCFLKGKYKNKTLIVIPSFNPLTIGTDVIHGQILSPLLKGSLDEFEVFVPSDDEVLYFGKIKDLGKIKLQPELF